MKFTVEELEEMAAMESGRPKARSKWSGFLSSSDRMTDERKLRIENGKRIISFGLPFLDDCLGGIFPNDLILIGAKTGSGKTSLASHIALCSALAGKRVYYFALEAEENEIERRVKFAKLSGVARQRGFTLGLNFLDWYTGRLDERLGHLEADVDRELAVSLRNLHTFYRSEEFYAAHYEAMVNEIREDADLIILDHLHYVDTDDRDENKGYKYIVKTIRNLALAIGKPVIVVAHLRKSERKGAPIVPSIEDFHGTSDIAKIATKAIVIAPAHEQSTDDPAMWPTYISPVKCRFEGSRTRFVALTHYDIRTISYSSVYKLGKLSPGGEAWTPVEKLPDWAPLSARMGSGI